MRSFLKRLFINNWPRKCLSIILSIIIWFVIHKSLTTTKTISNIPIRIENIPPGKTVEGIQSNGLLGQRTNLTLSGDKGLLDELSANDLQVVVDANERDGEWIAAITRKNLRTENSELNITQGISRVQQQNVIIKLTKLISEKIPIIITQPIGEPPPGYQFVDIWPYQLYITVSGPEEVIKNLKAHGIRLTFNLNDITKSKLDELRSRINKDYVDVVSYHIPDIMKQVSLPLLSSTPIEINDPDAKLLRIDFLRYEKLKLNTPIPVNLYFPPHVANSLNPSKITLTPNQLVENRNGIKMITEPLYAKGVSAHFLDVVKDMLEIAIIVNPDKDNELEWSIQYINARSLEEKYLRNIKSDVIDEELGGIQPHLREDYLRNRFRSYMNRLQLCRADNKPLELVPKIQGHSITLAEPSHDSE